MSRAAKRARGRPYRLTVMLCTSFTLVAATRSPAPSRATGPKQASSRSAVEPYDELGGPPSGGDPFRLLLRDGPSIGARPFERRDREL